MRVLVTRAAEEALAFCHAIEAAGHEPVRVPLLERVWEVDAVIEFAARNPHADWVVVTSAAAAEVLAAAAPRAWPNARLAAVGPATARELASLGRSPHLVPSEHTAAALVAAMPDLTGRIVVHPRGDLNPPDLVDALRARGADVREVLAYRNRAPVGHVDRLRAVLPVDATPLLSGSAATRLAEALGGGFDRLGQVIAIGPSTARTAREAGLPVHRVAEPHTQAGVMHALDELM